MHQIHPHPSTHPSINDSEGRTSVVLTAKIMALVTSLNAAEILCPPPSALPTLSPPPHLPQPEQ